jgi:hypothetical protein
LTPPIVYGNSSVRNSASDNLGRGSNVAFAAALVAGASFMALPANASTIDWTLSGVTFDDGGTASGTFSTDSTSGSVTAFDITTTAGTSLPGFLYDSASSFQFTNNYFNANSFLLLSDFGLPYLTLEFNNPLTSPGIDALVPGQFDVRVGGWECNNNCRDITGGEAVSATPLPATWTMLIAGFVGLGFVAYRGSKKNAAALAAA